jgi:hypothetical protein
MTVKMIMILSLLTCVKGLELKVRKKILTLIMKMIWQLTCIKRLALNVKKNSYFDYENDMAVNLY